MPKKQKVLIVDDTRLNIIFLEKEIEDLNYEVYTASSGEEAIQMADEVMPDVVLLDIMMPGMDGFEVCQRLKASPKTKPIPVIMVTALTDQESKYRGLQAGAIDFLTKPVDMVELGIRLKNVVIVKGHQDFLADYNRTLEKAVLERTDDLRRSFLDTIYRLTLAAEYKDKGTAEHLKRVSYYTALMARSIGLSEKAAEVMFHASPMHDIGKIGIPDHILLNIGQLSDADYELMKRHTIIGGNMLFGADSEYLVSASKFALYHHEHWDGSGYPHGLKGEEIPIEGRIMLLADRYDALRSARPYKEAYDHEKVLKIMSNGNERTLVRHFDPALLEVFKDHHNEFARIYRECEVDICH